MPWRKLSPSPLESRTRNCRHCQHNDVYIFYSGWASNLLPTKDYPLDTWNSGLIELSDPFTSHKKFPCISGVKLLKIRRREQLRVRKRPQATAEGRKKVESHDQTYKHLQSTMTTHYKPEPDIIEYCQSPQCQRCRRQAESRCRQGFQRQSSSVGVVSVM